MNEEKFWELVEKSKKSPDDQASRLKSLLVKISPAEIEAFHRILLQKMHSAYRWDLWAVAYIINGGCSDDGFLYFRGWLVGRGQRVYEGALVDPATIAKSVKDDECEDESFLFSSVDAYEELTGQEMPREEFDTVGDPVGERWKEEDLPKLYPKLCKKFGLS